MMKPKGRLLSDRLLDSSSSSSSDEEEETKKKENKTSFLAYMKTIKTDDKQNSADPLADKIL
jgi:hypothetical protein